MDTSNRLQLVRWGETTPTRKPYARDFKNEAVKLVTERGLPRKHVARDLGVDLTTLRRWITEFEADGERAFPGQGHVRDEELARSGARMSCCVRNAIS